MKKYLVISSCLFSISLYSQSIQQLKDSAAAFPEMPRETADLLPFTNGIPSFSSGAPFNDLEFTIFDTDYMDGENSGGDVFMPVDPSDAFPGSNKVKLIRCILNTDLDLAYQSGKTDRVILGVSEIAVPFFLRGNDGIDNDYCVIQHMDFNYGYIQLRGQPSDYRLVYCTKAEGCKTTGWYLFYTANNAIDLIAFIFPCWDIEPAVSGNPPNNLNPICNSDSTLSLLNPNHFRYAQPISATPSIPEAITQFGSNGKEIIGGMTMDKSGNTYFFGLTDGNLDGKADSENEIFINKIAPNGEQLWVTELPMKEGTLLKAGVTDSLYLYVAGRTQGNLPGFTNAGKWDGILLKISLNNGEIVAMNQWGNPGIDGYGNITQDDAGNIFVSAQGSIPGGGGTDDAYLVAKHQKSNLQNVWRTLNAPNASGFIASSEAWGGITYVPTATPGVGRLIVAGWYFSNLGANAFLSVYENLHTTAPTRPHSIIINSPGARADWVLDNKVDKDGNIYVGGFTSGDLQGPNAHLGEGDAYIIKYTPQLTNPKIVQFGTSKSDLIRKMEIDNDRNIIYTLGYTYGNYNGNLNTDPTLRTGDVFVQTFDLNLNPIQSKEFGTPYEDRGYSYLKDTILYVGGMTEGVIKNTSKGSFDGFLLALNTKNLSYTTNPTLSNPEERLRSRLICYPNPTNSSVVFKLTELSEYHYTITNIHGQQVGNGYLNNTQNLVSLDKLPIGIYVIELSNQEYREQFKVVKN